MLAESWSLVCLLQVRCTHYYSTGGVALPGWRDFLQRPRLQLWCGLTERAAGSVCVCVCICLCVTRTLGVPLCAPNTPSSSVTPVRDALPPAGPTPILAAPLHMMVTMHPCKHNTPSCVRPIPQPMWPHLTAWRSRCLSAEAAAASAPRATSAAWSFCRQGLAASLLLLRYSRTKASCRAAPQLADTPDCCSSARGALNTPCCVDATE